MASRVYPEQKTRELSEQEKETIRRQLGEGIDTCTIADRVGCAWSQVCGVKAAISARR